MKKFTFRLDSVLRWRGTQLQIERARLSQIMGEEARLKNELVRLGDERRNAVIPLQQAGLFETVELRALSAYLLGASARETFLNEQILRCTPLIAQQRARVLEAERNVKLLEKLRAKQESEWRHNFNKEIDAISEEAWMAAHFGGYNAR